MPIEIRELVIKGSVNEGGQQQGKEAGKSGVSDKKVRQTQQNIDRVMDIIRNKNER